jgi:hypothetical protein
MASPGFSLQSRLGIHGCDDEGINSNKIANQNTGEMAGVVARENLDAYGSYESNTFRCRISVDMHKVREEQSAYLDLPRFYSFGTRKEREQFEMEHLRELYREIKEFE